MPRFPETEPSVDPRQIRAAGLWARPAPSRAVLSVGFALAAALVFAPPAHAYIGPGAGFALVSSVGLMFVTVVLAIAALVAWPFRTVWRMLRHRKKSKPLVRRVVVVGLDGQDPNLTDRFLAEGKLPNFAKLAETGCYRRLRTTFPSVSPVAWSSFSTGVQAGKHNIFDFLDRDRRTYLPVLSSTRIGSVSKFLKIGKWRIPMEKPELTLLRRSKPFWTLLGEANIWSTVLRVPITFPPDRFYGAQLGAMSIPDLLGTQGTFLLFSRRASSERFKEGGTARGAEGERTAGPLRDAPSKDPTTRWRWARRSHDPCVDPRGHATRRAHVAKRPEHVLEPSGAHGWVTLTFPCGGW